MRRLVTTLALIGSRVGFVNSQLNQWDFLFLKPDQVNNAAFDNDYDAATAATTDFPATTGTVADIVTPPADLVNLQATQRVVPVTHMAPVTDYVEVKTIEATTESLLTTGPDGETATAGTTADYSGTTGAPGDYSALKIGKFIQK